MASTGFSGGTKKAQIGLSAAAFMGLAGLSPAAFAGDRAINFPSEGGGSGRHSSTDMPIAAHAGKQQLWTAAMDVVFKPFDGLKTLVPMVVAMIAFQDAKMATGPTWA